MEEEDTSFYLLLSRVKHEFDKVNNNNLGNNNFAKNLNLILDDCGLCINQIFNLIQNFVKGENCIKITSHLEDSVSLLQLLANSLKHLLEFEILSCSIVKKIPLLTGHIILNVFTHCKESESIYGSHLSIVEQQLKDLFKTCQDLQLLYLMIFEKHLVFDLNESEELQILLEVLNTNLKIGEIVIDLSLKAMVEQWKAFSSVCEKYSEHLVNQNIYTKCVEYLCSLIINNVNNSLTENQDQKVIIRSLKVSSFLLKIHLKIHQVLHQSLENDYSILLNMLCYIKIYCKEYLEKQKRDNDFINLFHNNVMLPADNFIQKLVTDELFYESLNKFEINTEKEHLILGNVLFLLSVMQTITDQNDVQDLINKYPLEKVIDKVFNVLPLCDKWLTSDLKLSSNNNSFGILDHLVVRCSSLIGLLTAEQFCAIEYLMYESILGTNTLVAVFAANLWILLSRICSPKLRRDHLTFLCKTYTMLSKNNIFYTSPQRIHISSTIKRMFEFLNNDEKTIFAAENILDDDNLDLWSLLEIRNLPLDQCRQYENVLLKKLKAAIKKVTGDNYNQCDIEILIKLINVTSTCPLHKLDDVLKNDMSALCSRLCKANMPSGECATRYVAALSCLVITFVGTGYVNKHDIVKIMHVFSTMKHTTETKLIILNLLNKLSSHIDSKYPNVLNSILNDIFKMMIDDTEDIVKTKAYEVILNFNDTRNYKTLTNFLKDSTDFGIFLNNEHKLVTSSVNGNFIHTCVVDITNSKSDNKFDFIDVDAIFEVDSEEPASKKVKLNLNEPDNVLNRIEKDVDILYKMKENVFNLRHKNTISVICDKLRNIIS